MYFSNSVSAKAAATMLMAGSALADTLTVIEPCPAAPASMSIEPITVTEQFQPVSTCAPTTVCNEGSCTSAYPMTTYPYVSTVIPCGWNGKSASSCTITETDQLVTVSDYLATITSSSVLPAPTGYSNHTNVSLSTTVVYETIAKHFVLPYHQMGPLAMPGYEGSGLCKPCEVQADGHREQKVAVTECRNGGLSGAKCAKYAETWVSAVAPSKTAAVSGVCSSKAVVDAAGTYEFVFPRWAPATTWVAPASTVTVYVGGVPTAKPEGPKTITVPASPWWATVTRSCEGPTTFDFTVTVTKTITFTVPCSTAEASTTVVVPWPTGGDAFPGFPCPTCPTYPTSTSTLGPIAPTLPTTSSSMMTTSSMMTSSTTGASTLGPIPISTSSSTSSMMTSSTLTTSTTMYMNSTTMSTSMTSTTTTLPLPSGGFRAVVVEQAVRFRKRAVNYVYFPDNMSDAFVTDDANLANIFVFDGTNLKTNGEYLGTEVNVGYQELEKYVFAPAYAGPWTRDAAGVISFNNAIGFCVAIDGEIFVKLTQAPPFTCRDVTLAVEGYQPPTTTTTSTTTTTTTTTDASGVIGVNDATATPLARRQYGGRGFIHRA